MSNYGLFDPIISELDNVGRTLGGDPNKNIRSNLNQNFSPSKANSGFSQGAANATAQQYNNPGFYGPAGNQSNVQLAKNKQSSPFESISQNLNELLYGNRPDQEKSQNSSNSNNSNQGGQGMYGLTPVGQNLNAGVGAGMSAGGQLSTQPVTQMVNGQMMLDPSQQAQLQRQIADQTAMDEIRRQGLAQGMGAGLGNQIANATTQRTMAVNAQANAAQNVANQLNNLANIRNQGANTILGAMQAGLNAR